MKLCLLIFLLSFNVLAKDINDYSFISSVPILSEGRIKPLDTFARSTLLRFHNKSSLKNKSAIQWLIELLFDQKTAYNESLFKIINDDVIKALDLKKTPSNLYTFIELYSALMKDTNLISELAKKSQSELEPSQKQILELHEKVILYLDISRSLSFISPEIEVPEISVRNTLQLTDKGNTTYLELLKRESLLKMAAIKSFSNANTQKTAESRRIVYLIRYLDLLKDDSFSNQFKILPKSVLAATDADWIAPWQLELRQNIDPQYKAYIDLWADIYRAYQDKSSDNFV
ncbi:MAG: hypothetical protein EHM20_10080, partial [Alphaproteobacteria bacterium]